MPCLITLTTDFGLRDPFVGIMKGVLLSICPSARLVDLTHEVPPQDILAGGWALEAAMPFFPPGTVHLAVVDPGVGSARRALAIRAGGHYFVGPDNGLFTFALDRTGWTAVSVIAPEYRLAEVSQTFHGRDVLAPAAAYLAGGVPLERLGPMVSDPKRLRRPGCRLEGGELLGEVLDADRFGNLITSIPAARLAEIPGSGGLGLEVAGRRLRGPVAAYAEGGDGEPAVIVGSTGRLEIFVRGGSARDRLGVDRGAIVRVTRAG
jgi:S-adenosyl-L-methionine hydrolase (adenosine-forming)